jgi:hypothetical protein
MRRRAFAFPAALGFAGCGEHRRGEFFVQAEKMLHPLAVARERLLAIEPIHRLVERAVRLAQILRHDIGIVEIGERRALMRRARVKHGFRKLCEFCFGRKIELRPREGIVVNSDRVLEIALQGPPTMRVHAMCMRNVNMPNCQTSAFSMSAAYCLE